MIYDYIAHKFINESEACTNFSLFNTKIAQYFSISYIYNPKFIQKSNSGFPDFSRTKLWLSQTFQGFLNITWIKSTKNLSSNDKISYTENSKR